MKRIIASALVVALSIGAAKAQNVNPTAPAIEHQHHHHRNFKKVIEKLNLTADQKEQFKALRADLHKQMTDLKSQSQLSASDMKARKSELHKQFRSKMEALLTPAQKDQLAQMRAAWKAHQKGNMAFQKHHRHTELKKELNLSDVQVAELKKMHETTKGEFQAIRNNPSLTADQKKAQMKELRDKRQETLKTVLSAEQFQKLQELRKQRREESTK